MMNDMGKWEQLFGSGRSELASRVEGEAPVQPPDDHAITFTIGNESNRSSHETGLRGTWTEAYGFVVPFASLDNAIDCLRLVIRALERERGAQ